MSGRTGRLATACALAAAGIAQSGKVVASALLDALTKLQSHRRGVWDGR